MRRTLPAVAAAALVAAVAAATARTQELPAIDPAEMAVVEQIRGRIEARLAEAGDAPAAPYTVVVPNTTFEYQMVPVPAGEFVMGSTAPGAGKDEAPTRPVKVDAFWMQAREVTWDTYLMFMFADQSGEANKPDALVDAQSRPTAPHLEMSFGRGNEGFPAISMTQHAANKYAQWLSAKTGEYYRLPTEAEWEYACRAGRTEPLTEAELAEVAWYKANSPVEPFTDGTYHKVGTKEPNAWGLYDMLGNVMEWTLDQYAPYAPGPADNPWVLATEPYPHAVRGGSWYDEADKVTCSVRVPSDPDWKMLDPQLPRSVWYMTNAMWLGFRLVRPAALPSAEDMYRAWNNGVEIDPY